MALDLKAGDWLVVPSLTFLATANAARYVGAEVVFADVDPDTGLMTGATLEQALDAGPTRRPTSQGGVAGASRRARRAARRPRARSRRPHGLPIVEDACHALGTTYDAASGTPARVGDGRYGTLATFSFHPVKTIAIGEGGMITTNDAELAARMRICPQPRHDPRAAAHARPRRRVRRRTARRASWYYEMHELGFNYRLTDVLCALGLSQLKKLDRFVARRRELTRLYDEALAPLAPLRAPRAAGRRLRSGAASLCGPDRLRRISGSRGSS